MTVGILTLPSLFTNFFFFNSQERDQPYRKQVSYFFIIKDNCQQEEVLKVFLKVRRFNISYHWIQEGKCIHRHWSGSHKFHYFCKDWRGTHRIRHYNQCHWIQDDRNIRKFLVDRLRICRCYKFHFGPHRSSIRLYFHCKCLQSSHLYIGI